MKNNLFRILIMVAMVVGITAQANTALAAVAANAPIINQASLTYDDGTGLDTIFASVTVTVTLVPAAPVLECPIDQVTPYTNPDTEHTYNYTLTAASNGPDDYTVAIAVSGSTNTTLSGASTPLVTLAPNPVRLGASITTTGSTATVIAIPSDSGVPNGSINDIAVNDYVVINGETRQVTSIVEDAVTTNSLTLDVALSSVPLPGTGVYEQVSFPASVFSGTLNTAGTDVTVNFDVTATNSNADFFACSTTSTYTSGIAVLTKYVRNLTDVAANTGGAGGQNFNIDSKGNLTYYTSGVIAAPGDVLEYVLVAQNTGAAPLTSGQVNDILPSDYVAFLGGQYLGVTDIVYQDDIGVESFYTTAVGDDNGQVSGGTNLTVWVGTGAAFNTGGAIPATSNVKVAYQVTVNP